MGWLKIMVQFRQQIKWFGVWTNRNIITTNTSAGACPGGGGAQGAWAPPP